MPLDILVIRDKDTCIACATPIYEARLELMAEGKVITLPGFECGCGRWVRDRDGQRQYVQQVDPEHEANIRALAAYLERRHADTPGLALDALVEKMLEDGEADLDPD